MSVAAGASAERLRFCTNSLDIQVVCILRCCCGRPIRTWGAAIPVPGCFATQRRLRSTMPLFNERLRSSRGQILIVTALVLPLVLGVTALVLDLGYLFEYQRKMQAAADSAALSAGLELQRTPSASQTLLETVARADAALNGFSYDASTLPITVTKSPAPYTSDPNVVKVTISQTKSTFFAAVLSSAFASKMLTVSAIAGLASDAASNIVVFGTDKNTGVNNLQHALELSGGANVLIDGSV